MTANIVLGLAIAVFIRYFTKVQEKKPITNLTIDAIVWRKHKDELKRLQ